MGTRPMSKHGHTFLTKQRWISTDEYAVGTSRWMWQSAGTQAINGFIERRYGLSLLGIINGVLAPTGFRLVYFVDDETQEIQKRRIKRWRNG
jgi:hypothetical protein